MKIIRAVILYAITVLVVYLLAFNPILLPIAGSLGLVKLTYVFLLLLGWRRYRVVLNKFSAIIAIYVILLLYSFFVDINGNQNFAVVYTQLVDFIELCVLPMVIAAFLVYQNISFPRILFIVATIASLVTFYAFIDSSFLQNLRSIQPEPWELSESLDIRGFGLSSELSSAYGWVLGVTLVYFAKYFRSNIWFACSILLVILAILVNARSGFVAAMIGISVYGVFGEDLRNVLKLTCLIALLLVVVANIDLSFINEGTYEFIEKFFDQIESIIAGNIDDTYLHTYANEQYVLPETIFQWLFGRGQRLFYGVENVGYSDVGYFNDLSLGGVVYLGVLYTFFYKVFKLTHPKWLFFAWILIAATLNIKGMFFHTNGCIRIMVLVSFYEYLTLKMEQGNKQC